MNRKHFYFLTFIIFGVMSLIILLLPVEVKIYFTYISTFIVYICYNIISIFVIAGNINKDLKKEIYGLSIYFVYLLFNLLLFILLVVSKFIYIHTSILLIILLLIITAYIIVMYFLFNSKKYINQKEENIAIKTSRVTSWLDILMSLDNHDSEDFVKLYEILRYMDPLSSDKTMEIDERIDIEMNRLKEDCSSKQMDRVIKLLEERKRVNKHKS